MTMETIRADLERYLRLRWTDPSIAVRSVSPFGDGHSGFTYGVDLNGGGFDGLYVMRLSPPGTRIAGPADVARQGRIMQALWTAGLPAPRVLALDHEPVIDKRAFVLMERVSGVAIEAAVLVEPPVALVDSALDVLRQLRALAVSSSGIAEEQPATLLDEVARWWRLVERAPDWLLASAETLRDRLASRLPAEEEPRLVHGDFHFGNLLFDGPRVAAVVDWEIAELGQPLIDFGSLAVTCLRHRYRPDPNPTGGLGLSVAQLISRAGVPDDIATWYVAFSCYKYAAILGYNLKLHLSGRRPDPVYEQLLTTIRELPVDGLAILNEGLAASAATDAGGVAA